MLSAVSSQAWAVRRANFPDEITFAVPGMIRFETGLHANRPHSFVAVSATGRRCALRCEHCRGKLLAGMLHADGPEELLALAATVKARGGQGLLLTGGCDESGRVPLERHLPAVPRIRASGLAVLAHCGLVSAPEAEALRDSGVDQALVDVIGDGETIRTVCHLDRDPEDYVRSLEHLASAGVAVAPHVVVGLHFGQLRGEGAALEAIARSGAERLVLVALKPLPGTPMARVAPVPPAEIGALAAAARVRSPTARLSFGCARPYGEAKGRLERLLVDAGVNALAFPEEATVGYAARRGLDCRFVERCCSFV